MANILVLNLGFKSIRSIIFSSNGEKLSSAHRPLETMLNDEIITQDPNEWWEKASVVINESLKELRGITIDFISVTASSSCLVYVDDMIDPLDDCIMVSDKRAKCEALELESKESLKSVQDDTQMHMDASLMLPKILWVKKHQPELYNKTYKFLSPNDFFIARMTGCFVTDYFNAQKYHYQIDKKSYPKELINDLGIDISKLPEVVAPGSLAGVLTEDAALELGFPKQKTPIKIIVSSYDAICSFFGSGASKEGEASDASGTVTVFRVFSKLNDLRSNGNVFLTHFPDWNTNMVGGSNSMGGGLIEWVKQCYYQNEPYPYEVIEMDARESRLGAGGLIFLPYLMGERAPVWNPDARGAFWGLERFHTRREMTRAVFESTGFITLDLLMSVEESGVNVGDIRVSGGLTRVNLVNQIKADVTGRSILVLSDFETTAIGAAILSLVGQGVISSFEEAAEQFVAIRMIVHPDRKNHEKYKEIFKLYKELYLSTKDIFTRRMNLINNVLERHDMKIENL